jgi:hypothetical protein
VGLERVAGVAAKELRYERKSDATGEEKEKFRTNWYLV